MINIQDIIPFMKKGWVAMDENGRWWWYERKPRKEDLRACWLSKGTQGLIDKDAFDIAPADDWTKSLLKVGGK
jgi:hypothetical protein